MEGGSYRALVNGIPMSEMPHRMSATLRSQGARVTVVWYAGILIFLAVSLLSVQLASQGGLTFYSGNVGYPLGVWVTGAAVIAASYCAYRLGKRSD